MTATGKCNLIWQKELLFFLALWGVWSVMGGCSDSEKAQDRSDATPLTAREDLPDRAEAQPAQTPVRELPSTKGLDDRTPPVEQTAPLVIEAPTIAQVYPELAKSGLYHARLIELPKGVLLRSADVEIRQSDIDAEISDAPPELQEQLAKNAFFLLEQIATQKLIENEARREVGKTNPDASKMPEMEVVLTLRGMITDEAKVTEAEIDQFYAEKKALMGDTPQELAPFLVREHLLRKKKEHLWDQHILTLGRRTPIYVSGERVKQYAELAKDNPVDRARAGGKPAFVIFGTKGDIRCDMMKSIQEEIRLKYKEKLNTVFIHMEDETILAMRYGVRETPLSIFYNAQGKEVFHYIGPLHIRPIEEVLARMGVK